MSKNLYLAIFNSLASPDIIASDGAGMVDAHAVKNAGDKIHSVITGGGASDSKIFYAPYAPQSGMVVTVNPQSAYINNFTSNSFLPISGSATAFMEEIDRKNEKYSYTVTFFGSDASNNTLYPLGRVLNVDGVKAGDKIVSLTYSQLSGNNLSAWDSGSNSPYGSRAFFAPVIPGDNLIVQVPSNPAYNSNFTNCLFSIRLVHYED